MSELPSIIMQTTVQLRSNDKFYVEISCLSLEIQSKKLEKCKFSIYLLNKDISFNIQCRSTLTQFQLPILEYAMEGTVSQFFLFRPSFLFYEKITKSYPFFQIK